MIPPAVESSCHFTSILSPPRKRNEHAGWFGYPRLWDGSEGATRTILAPNSETAAVMPPPEIEAMEPRDARLCHLAGRCGRRWQRCRLLPNRGVARPRLAPYCCRRPKGGRLLDRAVDTSPLSPSVLLWGAHWASFSCLPSGPRRGGHRVGRGGRGRTIATVGGGGRCWACLPRRSSTAALIAPLLGLAISSLLFRTGRRGRRRSLSPRRSFSPRRSPEPLPAPPHASRIARRQFLAWRWAIRVQKEASTKSQEWARVPIPADLPPLRWSILGTCSEVCLSG